MIKKKLCVELLGVGLPNRGAELMALTVMAKITERFGDCIFCTSQRLPFVEKGRLGLYTCIINQDHNATFSKRLKKAIKSNPLRKLDLDQRIKYGLVLDSEVDFVVDISGFAYGDFWGVEKARVRLGSRLEFWRKRRIPLFLLPQAFGPFSDPAFSEVLRPVFEYAEIVCARDERSAVHLKTIIDDFSEYPDITFSLPAVEKMFPASDSYALVIPNSKMFASETMSESNYFDLISKVVEASTAADITLYALNHEGHKDLALCHKLRDRFGMDVLNPENAHLVKQIISHSRFVFTSRFHGAVSSIACGVPPIVLGWSHKYNELMSTFGVKELLLDVDGANLDFIIGSMIDREQNDKYAKIIARHKAMVLPSLNNLWEKIYERLLMVLPPEKLKAAGIGHL